MSPEPFDRCDVRVVERISIDIHHPGRVSISLLDISGDEFTWVVFEADPELARKVAQAIHAKADEAERDAR